MGIGIDGSRACDAFGGGKPSAFRGTMWLNPAQHGQLAIQLLVDAIRNGKDLPETTFSSPDLITAESFAEHKDTLCSG